jgi:Tol biopolymer transport system component/tRNA A-37 threonylcarbamoyl transferase component Bud32
MGVVYKARDTHLDRFVALKVLPADRMADANRRLRFVQEAKAASALNHPNIVTIHDIDAVDGVHFIAMEYVAGKTLDQLIGRKGLKLGEALHYAVQTADALAQAHAAGIVHRDVKPSNVMVTGVPPGPGVVKVLDFGLAKLTEPVAPASAGETVTARAITEEGAIVGTVAYMSPEQAEGKPLDARSDIFSFGSLLYEMLTGQRAFQGETRVSTLAAILHAQPKPPSEAGRLLPKEVESAVMRCLRKDPQRRWQNMSDLKVALQDLKEESESGLLVGGAIPPARVRRWWWMVPAALLVLVAAVGATWWLMRGQAAPELELARLTFDSGLTTEAVISPDGKLAAYASDRSGEGHSDIWVQQISGRQVMRLTRNEAEDSQPSFSPDGSRIALRSERDGGGIYVVDTLGGTEQKIVDGGHHPRFSPDGSQIAFLRPGFLGTTGKIFLVSSQGGAPRPFLPEFSVAMAAAGFNPSLAWSPDGKFLVFEGLRGQDPKTRDWWVAPVAGGPPVATGALRTMPQPDLVRFPCAWAGRHIYFLEGAVVGSIDAYRVAIAPGTWAIHGPVEQLTRATEPQKGLSIAADGRMLLSAVQLQMGPWSVALDANQGTVSGQPQPIAPDSAMKISPACSRDGSKLAYVRWAGFKTQLRIGVHLRDMRTGQETVHAGRGDTNSMLPRLSGDGSLLAYRDVVDGKSGAYIVPAGGNARKVCDGCTVLGFFPDSKQALVRSDPNQLARLELDTGRQVPVLKMPGAYGNPELSPDGRWIAFVTPQPDGGGAISIAELKEPPAPIPVAEDRRLVNSPRWSPDGNLLYYVSSRDGWSCVWAQRLDPATKKPRGDAFAVLHSHGSPGFKMAPSSGRMIAVAADRLFLLFGDMKGNIWTAKVS